MKLQALLDWYSNLTPQSVDAVRDFYHEQAHFRDPFNDVKGHDSIAAIFQHMFETTEKPAFVIGEVTEGHSTAWVKWQFHCMIRGKTLRVEGVTHLIFGEDGRVIDHRDFWDSAELLAHLPLIGTMLRYVQRKLKAPQP